jgi:DNA-binding SARP family transcriptional activator
VTAWRFLVLGPLEVRRDSEVLALGGPKQRTVLALLLLESGHLVPTRRIIEHVWGVEGAEGAQASLQVYVSNLRKTLRDPGVAEEAAERLAFVRPGYRLRVEPGELDLQQVDDVRAQARDHRAAGDLATASVLLRLGLSLWRGPALADLAEIPSLAPLLVAVDSRRDVLRHECYDVELELGRHLALVPELEAAVAEAPLDERLAGQHMLALYRSGRQADALAVYRRTDELLRDQLGIEPGQALRALHDSILRQDLALDWMSAPPADLAATMTRDDRGVRGATLSLPNGVRLELGSRTWTVGRHPECDVVLSDPKVSRRHAEVRPVQGGYDLHDLGSSNGTRVGDEEIVERHRLADGDVVQVGSSELRIHIPA